MGDFGFGEILLIAIVVLVLFGAKKIPEMMRGLGKGVREFNDAKKGIMDDLNTTSPSTSTTSNNINTPINNTNTPTNTTANITDLEHEPVK